MKALTSLILMGSMTVAGISAADDEDVRFDPPGTIPGTPLQDAEPPRIAASGKNVFVIWHEFPSAVSAQPDVFLARSTNRGASFAGRLNLSNSAAADSRDEAIAVSKRNVFVVWSENLDELLFRRSTNNGSSFEAAVRVNDAGGAVHPQILASGSDVYLVWEALGQGGNNDIFFAQSHDNGHHLSDEVNLSNNTGPSEFPQLALSDDHVVVTWRDASTPGLDFEIFHASGE
jgi:hypothetical protein